MPMSYDEIREIVRLALEADHTGDTWIYIVDLYPDQVVYEVDGPGAGNQPAFMRRSYAIVDGVATLGVAEAVKREVAYVPMQAAGKLLAAAGDPADDGYGYQWRVQVVEYGLGADGRINWPREPIVAAIGLYDGAKVFALADSQHQDKPKAFGKSVREIVGWLKNPVDTGTGIEADFFVLKSAKWLRDGLVDSFDRGNPTLFGLSHDVAATTKNRVVAGKRVKEPVDIMSVQVDVVYDPTNNGKFLRMAAAARAAAGKEHDMFEKLLAALKKARPDVYETIDQEKITEDEVLELLAAAPQTIAAGVKSGDPDVAAKVLAQLEETQKLHAGMTLDRELAASKLPDSAQAILRRRYENRVFGTEDLRAAIKEQKEMIDALTGSGAVRSGGEIRIGRDSSEKLQAACDRMMGVRVGDDMAAVPPFVSLRAAYTEITGDAEVRGYLDPDAAQRYQRLHAAYGTATFSYVLGNTLYRRMVQDYRELGDFGLSRLVGNNIRNARDFRTMESVRIGYYGDLPDVSTQVDDYPNLGEVSDERIEYALNQKGGLITITRVMVINDDKRAVQRIVSRLPRAARRTMAKRGWNKFINNATYDGDSKAVFHADHGNLGSTAYGITSALAAKTAMAQQTEPDSGERLMLRPVTVAYPSELYGIVRNVNQFLPQAVAVGDGNSMYGFFQPEGLVECPFMTDANDWMMFGDPNECEILEMAFLNGQQEPEMFVADQPTQGQMFVADQLQYKIRHEYEVEIADYRNAYKAVVA